MKHLLFIFLQAGDGFLKNPLNDPNSAKESFVVISDAIFMVAPIFFFITTMWFGMHFISATPENKTTIRRHVVDSLFCLIFSILVLVSLYKLYPWLTSRMDEVFAVMFTALVMLASLVGYFLFFRKKLLTI
jgi:magnesium-transporting ATPase (P-type)